MGEISVDQLLADAPDVINKSTLGNLKQSFQLAKNRAETCTFDKMVDNLVFVGQGIDDVVDELAHALHKGKIEPEDYDSYILKIESFQWNTVPNTIIGAISAGCGCRVEKTAKVGGNFPTSAPDLSESISEEKEAEVMYGLRAKRAENVGDFKTSALYQHIGGEEAVHKKELTQRIKELR